MTRRIRPINWNKIEDEVDLQIWNKLTENFWLPEKVPLSNDLKSWASMSEEQKLATRKVFVGLTALDTIQGVIGAPALMEDAQTPHEEAVLGNITFMEAVHAKSYSSIFSTLCSSEEIEDTYRWAENNEYLLAKEDIIMKHYDGEDPYKKKIVSTLLESFLFYSGFYLPLYWSSRRLLTNTADVIKLIIRDESVHGYYIGYKYQKQTEPTPADKKDEYLNFTIDTLMELYDNEVKYTQEIYDPLGLTEDVKKFLKFNANKAMMNLGYDPLFSADQTDASAAVMSSLSGSSQQNHDFFSGSGSTYVIARHEETSSDDWDF